MFSLVHAAEQIEHRFLNAPLISNLPYLENRPGAEAKELPEGAVKACA